MSSIHSTASDCADEHITLDDLLLIEDAYYYNENASEPSEDFADHRDQEMLEANAVPNCEVRIEPWPVGDEDDEGNTIDSDELDYDGLGISDESEEEPQRSAGDGNWKSNYAKWMSNYKIPRKVQRHDGDVQRRDRNDEPCVSGSGHAEGSHKRRSKDGKKPRD
ncbi:hypothetical protein AAVH_34140 [Aphelenchoides avenae]|nr:hypothetical protein AAVH_34140 [Aphelenchus avenae]